VSTNVTVVEFGRTQGRSTQMVQMSGSACTVDRRGMTM